MNPTDTVYLKHVSQTIPMIDTNAAWFDSRASRHISDAIRADGIGGYGLAIIHYSEGVKNLDAVMKHTTDEKYLSVLVNRRATIVKRIETLKSFKASPGTNFV